MSDFDIAKTHYKIPNIQGNTFEEVIENRNDIPYIFNICILKYYDTNYDDFTSYINNIQACGIEYPIAKIACNLSYRYAVKGYDMRSLNKVLGRLLNELYYYDYIDDEWNLLELELTRKEHEKLFEIRIKKWFTLSS